MGKKLNRMILTPTGQLLYASTGRQVSADLSRELTVSEGRVYRKGRLYGTLPTKLTKAEQKHYTNVERAHSREWAEDWERRYKIRIDALVENAFRGLDNTAVGMGSGFSFESEFKACDALQKFRIFNEFDRENWERAFRVIYEEMLTGKDPQLGYYGRLVERFIAARDGVDADRV